MDASAEGPPESPITVVPAASSGDAQGSEAGDDAPSESASPTLDSSVVSGDAAMGGGPCSCTTPHADTSTCDIDGSCLETQCTAGYLDCDGDRTNGCETEFSTLNCGACGVFCNPSHVNRGNCSEGTCEYNTCSPGYLDCDGDKSNGCETAFSLANCGGCGKACEPAHAIGASCSSNGVCTYSSCAAFDTLGNHYLDCDGNASNGCESDPSSAATCGACGMVCSGAYYCQAPPVGPILYYSCSNN
jgi:hypothetical protein